MKVGFKVCCNLYLTEVVKMWWCEKILIFGDLCYNVVMLELTVEKKGHLNLKQDAFCKLYVSFDKEYYGNATACYKKIYGTTNQQVATTLAGKMLSNNKITARINELLSIEGFNDQNVDKQLLFIINQHKKLDVKMKGISEYNKLKKRVTDRLEISIPKPILDIDSDEETMRELDEKKKAKTVEYNELNVNYGLTEP